MLKGRRCYCDRLYPGFRCAYCRLDDVLAEQERPDPVEQSRLARTQPQSTTLWGRLSTYGKSVLRKSRGAR